MGPARRRDLVGECLFRFVFRSLYGMHAFNGDPHPGNYLFHGDGKVTFLDFGLVKHFTDDEMATFIAMVKAAAYDHDVTEFRRVVEAAGMLRPGCPAPDAEVGEYFSQFYESVRDDREVTWSSEYASRIVRHTFDRTSPIAQYATVPRRSCSSSGSTSGCTHCSASCARPATTGASPRSCGRSRTVHRARRWPRPRPSRGCRRTGDARGVRRAEAFVGPYGAAPSRAALHRRPPSPGSRP